jgi:FPC/CPF motif-containing protein YcgG
MTPLDNLEDKLLAFGCLIQAEKDKDERKALAGWLGEAFEQLKGFRQHEKERQASERQLSREAIAVGQELLASFDGAPQNDQLTQLGSQLIRNSVAYLGRLDENGLPPEIERLSYEGEYLLALNELNDQPDSPSK